MLVNHINLPGLGTPEGEAYWKRVYHSRIQAPESWYETAANLAEALEILIPVIDTSWRRIRSKDEKIVAKSLKTICKLHPVALMLLSYSIENYAKGLLIKRNPIALTDWDGKFPKLDKSHNVRKLVESVCNELTNEELELLARLGPHAKWAGRYPGPLDLKDFQLTDKRWGNLTESMRGGDFETGKKLLSRLTSMLETSN